jgi:hypothetical protein
MQMTIQPHLHTILSILQPQLSTDDVRGSYAPENGRNEENDAWNVAVSISTLGRKKVSIFGFVVLNRFISFAPYSFVHVSGPVYPSHDLPSCRVTMRLTTPSTLVAKTRTASLYTPSEIGSLSLS